MAKKITVLSDDLGNKILNGLRDIFNPNGDWELWGDWYMTAESAFGEDVTVEEPTVDAKGRLIVVFGEPEEDDTSVIKKGTKRKLVLTPSIE